MFGNNQRQSTMYQQSNNYYPKSSFIKHRKSLNEVSQLLPHSEQMIQFQNKNSAKQSKKQNFGEIHTPQFSQKFDPFVMNMSQYQSSSGIQNIISNSRNKQSVIQINQSLDDYPYTTQKLNMNFEKNLLKMMILKIKNDVNDLKQLKQEFYGYIKEVQTLIQYFKEKIIIQIQDYFNNKPSLTFRSLESNYQQLFRENQIYIANLENLLNKKSEEANKIQSRLQMQIEKNKNGKVYTLGEGKGCYNCQILTIKMNTLKSDNEQLKVQVQKLVHQNQIIYEQKFDLQQNIAGIDLQVQRRLKEEMKYFTLPIDRTAIQKQTQQYLFIINKLNQENAHLQKQYSHLEQLTLKQAEINQKQKQILQKELSIRLKQDSLLQSSQNNEKLRQQLLNRQNQLMIAESQFHKKIADGSNRVLKYKDEKYKQNGIDSKNYSSYLKDKHNLSGQSLQSFGNYKLQQNDSNFNKGNRSQEYSVNIYQNQQNQHIEIPMLALNQNNSIYQQEYYTRNTHQDSFEAKLSKIPLVHAQEPKNSTNQINKHIYKDINNDTIINKYQSQIPHKNSYKLQTNPLERSHFSKLNIESQGSIRNHNNSNYLQNIQKKNSPINYRQTSKNSRTSSGKKGFGNYLSNSQFARTQKVHQKGNINILGSKLQKLRQEIKRQIDSIN